MSLNDLQSQAGNRGLPHHCQLTQLAVIEHTGAKSRANPASANRAVPTALPEKLPAHGALIRPPRDADAVRRWQQNQEGHDDGERGAGEVLGAGPTRAGNQPGAVEPADYGRQTRKCQDEHQPGQDDEFARHGPPPFQPHRSAVCRSAQVYFSQIVRPGGRVAARRQPHPWVVG